MFTIQVGAFDALRGEWGDDAVDLFQQVLGDCSQPLVHNGDVTVNAPVTIDYCDGVALNITCGTVRISGTVTATGNGVILYAVAQGTWQRESNNDSYVDCLQASDRQGTVSGGEVRVYLPRAGAGEPNVRSGNVLAYVLDPNGIAVCVSDVNDDPIGTVKGWRQSAGTVPQGWELTGQGRVIVGFDDTSPPESDFFGTINQTGGQVTEPAHAGVTTDSDGAGSTSATTPTLSAALGGGFSFLESGTTGTASITSPQETGASDPTVDITGALDGNGDPEYMTVSNEETGVTVDDHDDHYHTITINSNPLSLGLGSVQSADSAQTSGVKRGGADSVLKHDGTSGDAILVDPGHVHRVYSDTLAAGFSVNEHTHEWTIDPTDEPHQHTFTNVEWEVEDHTHAMTASEHSHTTSNHTHSFTMEPHVEGGNLQPYLVIHWIRRTS